MPITLSIYIARQFFYYCFTVFVVIAGVIMVFDIIELTRIAAGKLVSFDQITIMAAQKTCLHIQKVSAFLVLIASILTYSKFTKTSEIIIFKTSGLSVWQFLLPSAIVGFFVGVFFITVFNPVTAYTLSQYHRSEASLLKNNASTLTISKTGLWIIQADQTGNQSIIHALKMSENNHKLYDITFYFIDENNRFQKRVDGAVAELNEGFWKIYQARITDEKMTNVVYEHYIVPTTITFEQIHESLTPPENLSFWKLPSFINIAENSGISAARHKLYYFKLFLMPLLFVAMLMLGAAFSLTMPRFRKTGKMLLLTIVIGVFIYFVSDLIFALGVRSAIPIWLAALSPAILTFLIALYFLIYFEEKII